MKATSLLEKQHRKVETILKKLGSGKGDTSALLRELADDLAAHMAIEQQIFYPAVRSMKKDLIAESFEEHALAELALKRLLATSPTAESFKAKVTALKELIEHHVEEEEEELFPAVEKKIDEGELENLGKRMKAAFEAALEKGFEALAPKSMATTTADVDNRTESKKNGEARHSPRA
jgi:iron-sulfur cluster repair protein YtfE (RIC family)